jgi:hypothetical protein
LAGRPVKTILKLSGSGDRSVLADEIEGVLRRDGADELLEVKAGRHVGW